MTGRPNHKALLTELLVMLLFFTLSQVIVLQVFIKAEEINHDTQICNHALMQAESIAETLVVSDNVEQELLALDFTQDGEAYTLTSAEGYSLRAVITHLRQSSGDLTTVELIALQEKTEMFMLPVSQYRGVSAP